MASKTLARTGASLINRIFTNSLNASKQGNSFLLPQISMNSPLPSFLSDFQTNKNSKMEGCRNADALKLVASPEGFIFPCGLPFLHFFIDDGELLFNFKHLVVFIYLAFIAFVLDIYQGFEKLFHADTSLDAFSIKPTFLTTEIP